MSEKVDQFCENVRAKVSGMEDHLTDIKAKIEHDRESTKESIDAKIREAKGRIGSARADAEAARTRMKTQVENKKEETEDRIAEWKHNREVAKLERRAEDLEAYASWAILVAADAIDEADVATLQAIAARLDADYVAAS